MAATIYDIAKEAKVGIGTVSRVLNNHPNVSPATKSRVMDAATRLNYHPHPYARGLARQRTNTILAVVPFYSTFFFVEILRGVQAKLSEIDCDLILYGMNHPDQVEDMLKKSSLRLHTEGVLFLSMIMPDSFAKQYADRGIPIVLVDTKHESFDSLYVENLRGAYIATNHLIGLGHTRIGLLNANTRSLPARERLIGFQRAMEEKNIDIDPHLVKSSTSTSLDGFTYECGYDLMKEFIQMGNNRPTALLVSSDVQASGALLAMEEAGIRCPEDIAIVGFDDIELAQHLHLTTMRQPLFEMGRLAASKIEERMRGSKAPVTKTPFVPQLVIRKTCGAKIAHDKHRSVPTVDSARAFSES